MKMYLISDNIDTCTGMRLAGIEGAVVHEKEELKAELNRAMADKDIAVVVLTEKFGQEFPEVIACRFSLKFRTAMAPPEERILLPPM